MVNENVLLDETEAKVTSSKTYLLHQDRAITHFNFLRDRINPECFEVLKSLEEEMLLAQSVAVRGVRLLLSRQE